MAGCAHKEHAGAECVAGLYRSPRRFVRLLIHFCLLPASGQVGPNFDERRSNQIVADEAGESVKQVQRFIRLNKLTPELMKMVDDGKLKTTPAVELSYLTPEEQEDFLSYMESEGCTPSL